MIIKEITSEAELDDLVSIDRSSFTSGWDKKIYSKMLSSNTYELFGGYVADVLTSFICITDTTDVIEVIRVAVSPNFRNQGFGKKLLEFIEKNSKREELFLEVRAGNKPAIALYTKFGFEKIGVRKKYYSDTNEDAVVMNKRVKVD